MKGRETTSRMMSQLGGSVNTGNKLDSSCEHPYYEKFIMAGCDKEVFKEIVKCQQVTDYDQLYTGFTNSLRRFRESFDTLGLMLCMSRDVNVIKYGVENQLITIDLENCYGDSALHLAALSGSAPVVAYMIEDLKIDPIKTETGIKANALHYAAMSNDIATLDYLINVVKLPLASKNLLGHNPLDYACTAGALNTMEYLYQLGLRPNINKICHLIQGAPNPDKVWEKLEALGAVQIERNDEIEVENRSVQRCQLF